MYFKLQGGKDIAVEVSSLLYLYKFTFVPQQAQWLIVAAHFSLLTFVVVPQPFFQTQSPLQSNMASVCLGKLCMNAWSGGGCFHNVLMSQGQICDKWPKHAWWQSILLLLLSHDRDHNIAACEMGVWLRRVAVHDLQKLPWEAVQHTSQESLVP